MRNVFSNQARAVSRFGVVLVSQGQPVGYHDVDVSQMSLEDGGQPDHPVFHHAVHLTKVKSVDFSAIQT